MMKVFWDPFWLFLHLLQITSDPIVFPIHHVSPNFDKIISDDIVNSPRTATRAYLGIIFMLIVLFGSR